MSFYFQSRILTGVSHLTLIYSSARTPKKKEIEIESYSANSELKKYKIGKNKYFTKQFTVIITKFYLEETETPNFCPKK